MFCHYMVVYKGRMSINFVDDVPVNVYSLNPICS